MRKMCVPDTTRRRSGPFLDHKEVKCAYHTTQYKYLHGADVNRLSTRDVNRDVATRRDAAEVDARRRHHGNSEEDEPEATPTPPAHRENHGGATANHRNMCVCE